MRGLIFLLLFAGGLIKAEDTPVPTIPLHLTLISDSPGARVAVAPDAAQWLVDTLNTEFHSGEGKPLAVFTLAGQTPFEEVALKAPHIANTGSSADFWAKRKQTLKNEIFRRGALNVFVYAHANAKGRSQGAFYIRSGKIAGSRQTDYWTWILLEHKALVRRDAKLLLHETGHAFGLPHVKPVDKDVNPADRNVMTGSEDSPQQLPPGESGYYFTRSQSAMVTKFAQGMAATFARVDKDLPVVIFE